MKKPLLLPALLLAAAALAPLAVAVTTADQQKALTPDAVLGDLLAGNARFTAGSPQAKDLPAQVRATASGQYPKAIVLSCVDSRVPVEAVFDQGLGDVFVARVAGNVEGDQTLGSMEFATKLAGAKLVLVLGHGGCGAVKGAIAHAKLGHLTGLLEEIRPAVDAVPHAADAKATDAAFVDAVIRKNVLKTVADIRARSQVLAELEKSGQIKIVGAYYDLESGKVSVLEEAK